MSRVITWRGLEVFLNQTKNSKRAEPTVLYCRNEELNLHQQKKLNLPVITSGVFTWSYVE